MFPNMLIIAKHVLNSYVDHFITINYKDNQLIIIVASVKKDLKHQKSLEKSLQVASSSKSQRDILVGYMN